MPCCVILTRTKWHNIKWGLIMLRLRQCQRSEFPSRNVPLSIYFCLTFNSHLPIRTCTILRTSRNHTSIHKSHPSQHSPRILHFSSTSSNPHAYSCNYNALMKNRFISCKTGYKLPIIQLQPSLTYYYFLPFVTRLLD